jgi:hypothetical protein
VAAPGGRATLWRGSKRGGSLTAPRILVLTTVVLALAVAVAPYQAWAPVAPKNCGMVASKGKRYNIKADQIRCRTARRQARRYLGSNRKPRGYTCRNYGRGTSIEFRCWKGQRELFAIRR